MFGTRRAAVALGLAASVCAGCGADKRLHDPDVVDAGGELDSGSPCGLPSAAVDLAEAERFAAEVAICEGLAHEGALASCQHLDVWLQPPDYGPDGVLGPWTVGRPVADCAMTDERGAAIGSIAFALPPVVFAPLQATWGGLPDIPDRCSDIVSEIVTAVFASLADAESAVHRFLACLGAEPDERIVECWGPVVSSGHANANFWCRIQILADDEAWVEPLRAEPGS